MTVTDWELIAVVGNDLKMHYTLCYNLQHTNIHSNNTTRRKFRNEKWPNGKNNERSLKYMLQGFIRYQGAQHDCRNIVGHANYV